MVVKTTELSTEKRTLVEGGKITTTVHEVEKVDGKITKDDVVKFVADGEPEVVSITGQFHTTCYLIDLILLMGLENCTCGFKITLIFLL